MNTLVLAGVNTKNSINLDLAQKISFAGNYDLHDLNDLRKVPMLDTDLLVKKEFPSEIIELHNEILKYDTIILVTPEHNGYFSAFFKNILDWLSRYENKYFLDKNIVHVVASPGVKGGLGLRTFADVTLRFTGAATLKNFGFKEYNTNGDFQTEIKEVIDYVDSL